MVGELEIASLGTDLGTDEDARSLGLGEVGGIAVALEEGEIFVEEADLDIERLANALDDIFSKSARLADDEDLFGMREFLNQADEPIHLRFKIREGASRIGINPGALRNYGLRIGEGHEVGLPAWEIAERCAGISEEDAAGAE